MSAAIDQPSILDTCLTVFPQSIASGGLILIATGVGWWLAADKGRWWVRYIRWWFDHVVKPLLATRSWGLRTFIIALNNSAVCCLLTLSGALGHIAWVAIAGVGLSLGTAFRMMVELAGTSVEEPSDLSRTERTMVAAGMVLNLLEPPAIMLSGGLCLAQGALWEALPLDQVLRAFAWVVLPTLVIAAGGEALWMHVYRVEVAPPDSQEQ